MLLCLFPASPVDDPNQPLAPQACAISGREKKEVERRLSTEKNNMSEGIIK